MPNMLVHLGVQILTTRVVAPRVDLRWVAVGCLIPDLPWIFHRVARELPLAYSLYDIRLYAIVQSSLLFCVILAAAFATVAARPRAVFIVLVLNACFHLLLDATQTKWANGVHLFAPWNWELLNFGLYWPESPITIALTSFGLIYVLGLCHKATSGDFPIARFNSTSGKDIFRISLAGAMLGGYFLLPGALTDGPARNDNHSVSTLRSSERAGLPVEFDRVRLSVSATRGPEIVTMTGERLLSEDVALDESALVSIKGVFVDHHTVSVEHMHEHFPGIRDYASYIGLVLIAALWLAMPLRRAAKKLVRS